MVRVRSAFKEQTAYRKSETSYSAEAVGNKEFCIFLVNAYGYPVEDNQCEQYSAKAFHGDIYRSVGLDFQLDYDKTDNRQNQKYGSIGYVFIAVNFSGIENINRYIFSFFSLYPIIKKIAIKTSALI